MSTEPLRVEFEVGVPAAQAFEVWTQRCGSWWPRSHTISGDPAAIVFEPRPGGRIVEQARDGRHHEWGEILEWDPPARLRYRWHLFFDPSEATEVEVTFTEHAGRTGIRLQQTGWDELGQAGPPRRAKTEQVWTTVAALYVQAC
jgi:uncharacterized protein YndB with AHSA1/START domain